MFRLISAALLSTLVVICQVKGQPDYRHTACYTAMDKCEELAQLKYPDFFEAVRNSRGPRAEEDAIFHEITSKHPRTHCSNLGHIVRCFITTAGLEACRESYYGRQLARFQEYLNIFNRACQPDNVATIAANIECISDRAMVMSVEGCPRQGYQEMLETLRSERRTDRLCSDAAAELKGLILTCAAEKINESPNCASAATNGGTDLALQLLGGALDVLIKQQPPFVRRQYPQAPASPDLCIDDVSTTTSPAARDEMTFHKRIFEDIFKY